jgi:lipopolysaccharide transport system ATP-binding protein
MSSKNVAVSVRGLGKSYALAQAGARPTTLAEAVTGFLRGGRRANDRLTFWAVKDVSFDVREGDVVGVVGRNGAGKSTLLKLLSRITEPTEGQIELWGRVGSLLEVGTGFHPELTGRENVYLNGAILGMTRPEIDRQFDAIVDFAEVEKFLETPVKRYSSGMYVRLAFAVAAHLNPEILIVDEVLAVGDAAFQRKCLGKMQDVAKDSGRTILFVSHNMAAVRSLCNRALLLRQGGLALDGTTEVVVSAYVQDAEAGGGEVVWPAEVASAPEVRFRRARALAGDGSAQPVLDCAEPCIVEVEYDVLERQPRFRVACHVLSQEGVSLCTCYAPDWSAGPVPPGRYVARCTLPGYTFNEGVYYLRFDADIPGDRVVLRTPANLTLTYEDIGGHGLLAEKLPGVLRPRFEWRTFDGGAGVADAGAITVDPGTERLPALAER